MAKICPEIITLTLTHGYPDVFLVRPRGTFFCSVAAMVADFDCGACFFLKRRLFPDHFCPIFVEVLNSLLAGMLLWFFLPDSVDAFGMRVWHLHNI